MNISRFKRRILVDLQLVCSNFTWLKIGVCIFQLLYLQTIVARKLAFYRHMPIASYLEDGSDKEDVLQHTLMDMGHELTPDYGSERWIHALNSKFLQVFSCFVGGIALLPYILDQGSSTICPYYSLNMGVRFLYVVSTGKLIRIFVFLPTSLPGSAMHCVGEMEEEHHPKHFTEIFRKNAFGGPYNCGDLIYSGHMLVVTATMCYVWYYLTRMVSRRAAWVTMCFCIFFGLIQFILILLTRSHYSVDLTLGVAVGFCLWHTHSYVWRPKEPEPHAPRVASLLSEYMSLTDYDSREDGAQKDDSEEPAPAVEKTEIVLSDSSSSVDSHEEEFHQRQHAGKRDL